MFCMKCGNQLNDGAQFCPKCGERTGAANIPRQVFNNYTNTMANNNTNELKEKIWACGGHTFILVIGILSIMQILGLVIPLFSSLLIVPPLTETLFGALVSVYISFICLFAPLYGIAGIMIFNSSKKKKTSTAGYTFAKVLNIIKIIIACITQLVAIWAHICLFSTLSKIAKEIKRIMEIGIIDKINQYVDFSELITMGVVEVEDSSNWTISVIEALLGVTDNSIGGCRFILILTAILISVMLGLYIAWFINMNSNISIATKILEDRPSNEVGNISQYTIVGFIIAIVLDVMMLCFSKLVCDALGLAALIKTRNKLRE